MLLCVFCRKECKNENSKSNHERLCRENPNRQYTKFHDQTFQRTNCENQFTKAKKEGRVVRVSDETRRKISESLLGKTHTEETKSKLSDYAKSVGFGGVTRSRRIEYSGKFLGSSYELTVAKELDANEIRWDTCSRFKYIDPDGKERTYTPDIYLIDYDVYLDPKNDFLINNPNPKLGFYDSEKIKLACEQNGIVVHILSKDQLSWEYIKTLLHQ